MSGVVATVGDGVEGWTVGDRVTVMPLDWCGDCPACLAGHTHVCHDLNFIGIDSPGAMQATLDRPGASRSWRFRTTSPCCVAALAEPTAVAVHDVRRAVLVAGEQALVVGGGPIGLLVALVARAQGAEVLVLEPSHDPARARGDRSGSSASTPARRHRRRGSTSGPRVPAFRSRSRSPAR